MSKRLLSLHRRAPGLEAQEALDAVLVAAVFDQQIALLFREAGIQQLIEAEVSEEMALALGSLSDYGIQEVYVCAEALRAAQISGESLLVPAQALTPTEQSELLATQDMVLCD